MQLGICSRVWVPASPVRKPEMPVQIAETSSPVSQSGSWESL